MAIPLNDGLDIVAPKNIDNSKGVFESGQWRPYNSKAEIFSKVTNPYLSQEFPVWNSTAGVTETYVLQGGITIDNLVKKIDIGDKSPSLTLAALRAIAPKSDVIYQTVDNGGGQWFYDITDTTSVDNTGTIIVTSSGKRLKRIWQGSVSVVWFGAKGDNSTNDTSPINNALLLYDNVEFPMGYNFLISDELFVQRPGAKITGLGTITQTSGAASKNVFNVKASFVNINGHLNINGAIGNGVGNFNDGMAMVFAGKDISGLKVSGLTGIKQSGVVTKGANDLEVHNLDLKVSQIGIHFSGIVNTENAGVTVYVSGFKAYDNKFLIADVPQPRVDDGNIRGIRASWASDVVIDRNTCLGFSISIEVWRGNGLLFGRNSIVSNNTVDTWISYDGMEGVIYSNLVDYSLRPANAVPARTPLFNYTPVGIEVIHCQRVRVAFNRIYNLPGSGILTGLATQVLPNFATDIELVENTIVDCGILGAPYPAMALGAVNGLKVFGGTVVRPKSGGVSIVGATNANVTDVSVNNVVVSDGWGDAFVSYYSKNIDFNNCKGYRMKTSSDDPSSGNGLKLGVNNTARAINISVNGGEFIGNQQRDVTVSSNNSNPSTVFTGTKAVKWTIDETITVGSVTTVNILAKTRNIIGRRSPAAGLPIHGNWVAGEKIELSSSNYSGITCITAGTMGTLVGVTGTGVSGSGELTVNDATYLLEDNFILIAGAPGTYRVISISGNVLTIAGNLSADVTGAAVTFSPAVFDNYGSTLTRENQVNKFITPSQTTDPTTLISSFDLWYNASLGGIKISRNNDPNFNLLLYTKGNNTVWVNSKDGGSYYGEDRLDLSDKYIRLTSASTTNITPGFTNEFRELAITSAFTQLLGIGPNITGVKKYFKNTGTAAYTITLTAGVTIDGLSTGLVLYPGQEIGIMTTAQNVWISFGFNNAPVIDTSSTVFTKSTLNTKYPLALIGFKVIQDATGKIYTKEDNSSTGNWNVATGALLT